MENVKCLPRPVQTTSPARVVASQLRHQPNSDRTFLKPFTLDFFLFGYCGAFFGLAIGHKLFRSFNDAFKLTSTIYKGRTRRPARRLPNTNV